MKNPNPEHASMEKVTAAKIQMILRFPFFAYGLMGRLQTVIVPEDHPIQTAGVDGRTLWINEGRLKKWSEKELMFVLAHEVMHCAAGHHSRMKHREPQKWNIACDLAINPMLLRAGLEAPQGCLLDEKFDGMSAEEIYEKVEVKYIKKVCQQGPHGDPGGTGGVEPLPSENGGKATKEEINEDRREWTNVMSQAAKQARAVGKGTADTDAYLTENQVPELDWRQLLREFITSKAKDDWQWTRPNRRLISQGLYLPGLDSDVCGRVVIAVDTSGSVSEEELKQFGAEINSILEDVRPSEINVFMVDSSVCNSEEYTPYDLPLKLNYKGRGGTAFTPAFRQVEKEDIQPACFIYLTDLGSDDYPDAPDYPVMWVATGHYSEPPFGTVVDLEIGPNYD